MCICNNGFFPTILYLRVGIFFCSAANLPGDLVTLQKNLKKSAWSYFYNRCDVLSQFILFFLSQRFNLKCVIFLPIFIYVHAVSIKTTYHLVKNLKGESVHTEKQQQRINSKNNRTVHTCHCNGKARDLFL